jgi:ABC-type branched-subunit amino acid transport system ATPase component
LPAKGFRRATAEFAKGAITSIIGPNVAGKTTTLPR